MVSTSISLLAMTSSAVYRVLVRGHLDTRWSSQLEGMKISCSEQDGREQSVLVGRLADQSALMGVLNTLYELHAPIESVDCIEVD